MHTPRLIRARHACQSYAQNFFQRYVFTFNTLLLLFLTFQSSVFVLLSTYVQQRKSIATGKGKPFTPSHFLICVEFTKLLLSLFWCALDVRRKRHEGTPLKLPTQDARFEVIIEGSSPPWPPLHQSGQELKESEWNAGSPPQLKGDVHGQHAVVYKLQNLSVQHSWRSFLSEYLREMSLYQNNFEGFMMLLPAVWYGVQNYFILNALRNLDPTTFQLFSQLRIPIIAFVMYIFLGVNLNSKRCLAIIILFVGVMLSQINTLSNKKGKLESVPMANSTKNILAHAGSGADSIHKDYVVGIISVVLSCTLSSISSVYMEWVFKKRAHRCLLSVRNIHLAFFSILYFITLGINEYLSSRPNQSGESNGDPKGLYSSVRSFLQSYFTGFDYLVVILVLFHASRGIIVALVMRYSDNIMRSFSIGASILLSGLGSILLFDSHFTFLFLLASALVITSIFIYNSA